MLVQGRREEIPLENVWSKIAGYWINQEIGNWEISANRIRDSNNIPCIFRPEMDSTLEHPIILFDGVCNLCNGSIQFVIKRDKKSVFRFGALQSEEAKEILSSFHTTAEEVNSAILIENGKMFLASTAVIKILSRLPHWHWFRIFMVVPKFLRDFAYHAVGKYRYKIFGRQESCMIPTPELKAKFIDNR